MLLLEFFVQQLLFFETMFFFVLFHCEISYFKLTSCKSKDLSQKRKLVEIIMKSLLSVFSVFYVRPIISMLTCFMSLLLLL